MMESVIFSQAAKVAKRHVKRHLLVEGGEF